MCGHGFPAELAVSLGILRPIQVAAMGTIAAGRIVEADDQANDRIRC